MRRLEIQGLADPQADPQAVQDLVDLGVNREDAVAALLGEQVAYQYTPRPADQWREGYTKANLVTILGRKTKAQLENAVGVRARTKGRIFEALGGLTKDELAEILGFISPTTEETRYRDPVYDASNIEIEAVIALYRGEKQDTQVRPGTTSNFDFGPFPDLQKMLDDLDAERQNDASYVIRYAKGYQLKRKNGSWYVTLTYWQNQSDRKRRGRKRNP